MPTYEFPNPKKIDQTLRNELSEEQNDLLDKIEELENDHKDASGAFRKSRKAAKARVKEIKADLKAGLARQRVEVDEEPQDGQSMIAIYKKGTRDLLDTRPMTDKEEAAAKKRRQVTLFDEHDAPAATNGKATNGKANGKAPALKASSKKNGKADDAVVPDDYVPEGVTHRGQKLKHSKKNKSGSKGKRA